MKVSGDVHPNEQQKKRPGRVIQLNLEAGCYYEEVMLAHIADATTSGGYISIELPGRQPFMCGFVKENDEQKGPN
jgi:hypothetical protein